MTRLASRFGAVNTIRRDRPLTNDELARHVPSIFSEEKHASRSDRYTYIPPLLYWITCVKKASNPSSPARPGCVTWISVSIPNTCCVYAVRIR